MLIKGRLLAVAAVCGALITGVGAAPAQAGLLGGLTTVVSGTVGGVTNTAAGVVASTPLAPLAPVVQNLNVVPTNYDPVAPIVQMLGGQIGPITAVNQVLCPPLTKVAQLVASLGQPALASGITTLGCSTGILEYKFVTHFRKPDGSEIEKTFNATFAVPTLMDVDGDGLADFIGTLSLTNDNSIGLTVDRMATNTATSPTEIEAIVKDPGGLLLGDQSLRFGFDSRMDRAPQRFVLSTPLATLLAPSPTFKAAIGQATPGNKVALVAGTFKGTYQARVNPTDLTLLYGASPTNATITATIGAHDAVSLTQNKIGPATITGHIVNGTDVQDFNVDITDLPITLGLDFATGNTISGSYSASARVAKIRGTLTQTKVVGSTTTLLQKAILNLDDVPTGLNLTLNNDNTSGSITTTGGPLGLAKVGIANGEPKFLTDAAYVDLDDDGTVKSISAQIPGIENVNFTTSPVISLGATLQATPFRARIAQVGRLIEARVNNVPHQIDLAFNPTALTLDYDGHGSGIGQVTVDGTSTTPFVGRATNIKANILNIPAVLHAAVTLGAGGGQLTTTGSSGPIGSIELAASNGSTAYPAGSGQGVAFHDVPNGEYRLAARVLGLRSLSFDTSNGAAVSAFTQGGPFSLDVLTGTLAATGLVEDLPAQTTINYNRSANTLQFTGRKADNTPVGINKITLDANSIGGNLIGSANRVNAIIEGIPADELLTILQGTNQLGVTASAPINKIELIAANHAINRAADLPNTSGQGVKYIDQGGVFTASARVLGFKKLIAQTGSTLGVDAETAGGPFRADVATGGITADAVINDLPAKMTLTANLTDGRITFKGRTAADAPAPINSIDVNAASTTALFGRATNLKAHITGIPADLTIDFAQTGNGLSIEADNAIGLVEVGAANRALAFPADLPTGTNQGVNYTDTTANFVIGARIRQIKKLAATLTDPISIEAITEGGPFLVNATTNTLTAHAAVLDLPAHILATLDLGAGKLTVDGFGQPIAKITADAHSTTPLFGRATDVNLNIEGIPSPLVVDFITAGNQLSVEANSPISLIEVAAANRAPALPGDLPAGNNQGVNYTDTTADFVIGARLKQVKKLAASLTDPISIETITSGGPFLVNATTNTLTAHASVLDLPAHLLASLDLGAGKLTVNGFGQGIGQIKADAHSTTPLFGRATDVNLNVQGIPALLTVDFTTSGGGVSVVANNPIDLIELVAANRAPALPGDLPVGNEQGLNYKDLSGGDFVVGARIKKLKELSATLSDPITVTAKTDGGPFKIHAITDGLTANASISDLPHDLFARLSIDEGKLNIDGHGEAIGQVKADAHSSTALFGRATDLDINVQGIPATLQVDLTQSGNGVDILASAPIGLIEVMAANRTPIAATDLPLSNEQGINYVDQAGGDFLVGARIKQLKRLGASFGSDNITLDAETDGGPFGAHVLTDGLEADARVEDLPHNLHVGLNLSGGSLQVDGHGEGIGRIYATAHSDDALFGRVHFVNADVRNIPSLLNVDFSENADGLGLTANAPIGLIEVVAANRAPAATDLPAGTDQGIVYKDVTGGDFVLGARVRQLSKARIHTDDPIKLSVDTEGGVFTADVDTDTLDAQARIDELPSHLAATIDLANAKLIVDNSARIDEIHVAAQSTTPLFLGAKNIQADILGVPANLNIDFAESTTDGIGLNANEAIDSIELAASSNPINYATDLPSGGRQGIKYIDKGGVFTLGARVRDLKSARVSTGTPIKLGLETEGGPFNAFIDTDDVTANADIEDLPAKLTLTADLDSGGISVTGRNADNSPAGIAHLLLDASSTSALFLRADHVHADIHGIGSDLNLNLAQAAGGVNLTATQAIDSIEVVARKGAIADPNDYLPTGGRQGASFIDKTGGDFLIAARVLELKRIEASLDPTVHIGADTAGGEFVLHAETDDLTGDALIRDLPKKLDVGFDLDGGQIAIDSLDGNGDPQRIDQITVNLSSATPVFGGATAVAANIEGIPGHFTLDLAQTANGLHLEANDPIDLLEIAAQDSPITNLATTIGLADQGARFHDADAVGGFKLAARIRKLSLVDVSLDPNISLQAKTQGGRFDIDVDAAGLKSDGYFDQLPADVTLGLDQTSGALTFTGKDAGGNPQGVDHTFLEVSSDDAFFAGAKRLSLAIEKLSPTITLNLANSGSGGSIIASDPIDSIEIQASSDPNPAPFPAAIPAGEQGVVYNDNAPDFLLAARLLDLESLTFGLAGDSIGLESKLRSTVFNVDIDAQGLNATARIDKLPRHTTLDFDLASGHFVFDGKDANDSPVGIDSIEFGADADPSAPLFGAATKLRGTILTVPPHMDIGFDQEAGAVDLTTNGGAIGSLDFLASNNPAATYRSSQGITLHDTTDDNGTPGDESDDIRDFNLSAKVLGLQTLQAGIAGLNGDDPDTPEEETGAITLSSVTAGGVFDLDIASDSFTATGLIDQLPPVADIVANLGDGEITFNGHGQGISHLNLTATAAADSPIFGRANHLYVNILDLPQHVTVGIAQPDESADPDAPANTGASIEASDPDTGNPLVINLVEIGAWNDTAGNPLSTLSGDGVIYHDLDTDPAPDVETGDFAIGARIHALTKLVASFGSALDLQTITAGGPFHASIQTAGFDEDTGDPTGLGGNVDILNLPSNFNLQANLGDEAVEIPDSSTPDPDDTISLNPGTIAYAANATIGELKAEIDSATPLISDANHFLIDLQGLPTAATIGVAPDSGQLTLSAGGGQIGQVDLRARDDGTPAYPPLAGAATEDSAFLDGTGGHFALAARIFNLKTIAVTLEPISLHAEVGGTARPFRADIKLPPSEEALAEDPATPDTHAKLDVLNLPPVLDVGLGDIPTTIPDPENPGEFLSGGSKLTFASTGGTVGQLLINVDGIELLPGAEGVGADIRGLPAAFALTLPDQEVVTGQPLATLTVPSGQINELRLAAGGVHLTDANMATGGTNDLFKYYGNVADFGVGVKLTGIKGLSMNLDPVNLSIDQNAATTKPVSIDAKLPQETPVTVPPTPPLPDSIITGTLNKPTAHTELGVDLTPGQPTQLNLRNGAVGTPVSPGNANQTMQSMSLNLTNLGTIPSASFSLTKVPQILKACLATDGNCIRTDTAHAVTQYANWTGPNPCTPSPQVPGNLPAGSNAHRPYNPQTSLYFDDSNTSTFSDGINSANNRNINNMVTMNATIGLPTGPVIINNMRFHNISLDFADSGTSFQFKPIVSIGVGDVPRIYLYIDSQKYPFVLNDVRVPPSIPKLVMGTDSSPARAFKRMAWTPGAVRGSILGCGISQNVSTQAQNSLDCGGAKELQISTSLGTLNAFNLPLFGDVLNICGGTVPTT